MCRENCPPGSIIESRAFFLGAANLLFLSLLWLISLTVLALSYSLSLVPFVLASLGVVAFLALSVWRKQQPLRKNILRVAGYCGVFFTEVLGLSWIAGSFYDVSFDGQTYHQQAVFLLIRGWNFFADTGKTAQLLGPGLQEYVTPLNHYPKFPWLVWAALTEALGGIEQAKFVHLLFIVTVFCFALLSINRLIVPRSRLFSSVLALAVALNPVSVCQSLTFYVDGLMGSLLTCVVLLFSLLCSARSSKERFLLALFLALAIELTVNVKFTAAVAVAVICSGFVLWLVVANRARVLTFSIPIGLGLLIGFGVTGFHPYVANYLSTGKPFFPIHSYPLSGVTPKDEILMKGQEPENFYGYNRFEKLFVSLLAAPGNTKTPETASPRPPWKIRYADFSQFSIPDVRTGGFGPLFGPVLIVSFVLVFLTLQSRKMGVKTGLILSALLFMSILINPESWWARYVPQLWLVPFVLALPLLRHDRALFRGCSLLLFVLLLVNSASIALSYYRKQSVANRTVVEQLDVLGKRSEPVQLVFGRFRASAQRLAAAGIPYQEVAGLTCDVKTTLAYTDTGLCYDDLKPAK